MFLEIAQEIINTYSEGRVCPDQCIGTIKISNNTTQSPEENSSKDDFKSRTNLDKFERTNSPLIIMVLESPHTSEFSGVTPKPVAGNGNGHAGKAIRELFSEVFDIHNFLRDGEYNLIILNAVQYQCSLGEDTKKYRDKVFIECWNKFARNDFKKRLLNTYESGDIIINACTAGKTKPKLREIVKSTITKLIGPSLFEVEHPSNWVRTYNAARKNKLSANYNWKS